MIRWNQCKKEKFICSILKLQLGTGSNYNVSINLSGLILLGLGVSTALLAHMLKNALGDDKGSSYDSGSGYASYGHDTSGYAYRRVYGGRQGHRGKVIPLFVLLTWLVL